MNTEKTGNKIVACTTAPDFANPGKAEFTGHMPTRFLRKKSVMLMTGISASGIYDLMNRGLFPKSIKLPGGKAVAWLLSDIEEWQRQTIAANSKAA